MFNVILPSTDADAVTAMQSALDKNYNIYLVTASAQLTTTGQTIYYTRLSAQVRFVGTDVYSRAHVHSQHTVPFYVDSRTTICSANCVRLVC
jgi:hypothetical protein